MTAKSKLGQHWLNDISALRAIIRAADIAAGDTVLEVGPGQGALTRHLLKTGAQVVAVELDQSLIDGLKTKFASAGNLQLVDGDIRRFDLGKLTPDYLVVANIPYYLSAPLLKRLVDAANPPRRMALMVQREVAQRLAAEPGDMSILAVAVQLFGQVSLDKVVPAAAFTPPPEVDSQIVVIKRRTKPVVNLSPAQLMPLVRHGFANRRKTLVNSLSGGLSRAKPAITKALAAAGLSATARAQELSLKDWEKLYNYVQ